MINPDRLNEQALDQLCKDIMAGLFNHLHQYPDDRAELLHAIIYGTLKPLSDNDFFGTEGWEVAFGVE